MLLPVVALARAAQAIAWTALELQGRLRRANIVCVLLAGLHFSYVNSALLCESECACGTVIFKEKWRFGGLKSSNFSGLAGRRLKAGAAEAPHGRRGQEMLYEQCGKI